MEARERETMDQLTTNNLNVEGVTITESGEEISSFENPSALVVVQQPFVLIRRVNSVHDIGLLPIHQTILWHPNLVQILLFEILL